MKEKEPTIFVFSPHDISTVQGTTEPYYVCKRLAEEFDTTIFAPLAGDFEAATTRSTRYSGLLGAFVLNVLLVPYWVWLARTKNPDVVYSYRNVVTPSMVFGTLSDARIVFDIRADPYQQPKEMGRDDLIYQLFIRLSKAAHKRAFDEADAIITLSDPLKQQLCRNFDVDEEKVHLVPLGVDVEKFRVHENGSSPFTLVYVGSINEYRDLETVVRALRLLDEEVQENIRFEVIGSAPASLRRKLHELAAPASFEFVWHGFVDHEEIPELAGRAHVSLSPLLDVTSFEVSSPAKIYEYLAMGLPVIATDIVPHRRILEDRVDSMFVEPGDEQEFKEEIEYAYRHPGELEQMSERARQKSLDHSWSTRIDSLVPILERSEAEEDF